MCFFTRFDLDLVKLKKFIKTVTDLNFSIKKNFYFNFVKYKLKDEFERLL